MATFPTLEKFVSALMRGALDEELRQVEFDPAMRDRYPIDQVMEEIVRENGLRSFLRPIAVKKELADDSFLLEEKSESGETRFNHYWRERGILSRVRSFNTLAPAVRSFLRIYSYIKF